MKLFVSYARRNADPTTRARTAEIPGLLEAAGFEVWVDRALKSGEDWWDEILASIRGCDLFLPVLSVAYVASEPCRRELAYAEACRRRIVPLLAEPVAGEITPASIARVQYHPLPTDEGGWVAFNQRLREFGGSPPLPEPLPVPPGAPLKSMPSVDLLHRTLADPPADLDEASQRLLAHFRHIAEEVGERLDRGEGFSMNEAALRAEGPSAQVPPGSLDDLRAQRNAPWDASVVASSSAGVTFALAWAGQRWELQITFDDPPQVRLDGVPRPVERHRFRSHQSLRFDIPYVLRGHRGTKPAMLEIPDDPGGELVLTIPKSPGLRVPRG